MTVSIMNLLCSVFIIINFSQSLKASPKCVVLVFWDLHERMRTYQHISDTTHGKTIQSVTGIGVSCVISHINKVSAHLKPVIREICVLQYLQMNFLIHSYTLVSQQESKLLEARNLVFAFLDFTTVLGTE